MPVSSTTVSSQYIPLNLFPRVLKLLFTRDKVWDQIIIIKASFPQDYSMASPAFISPLSPILSSRYSHQLWLVPTTSWSPPSISSSRISAPGWKRRSSLNAKSMLFIPVLFPAYKGVYFQIVRSETRCRNQLSREDGYHLHSWNVPSPSGRPFSFRDLRK